MRRGWRDHAGNGRPRFPERASRCGASGRICTNRRIRQAGVSLRAECGDSCRRCQDSRVGSSPPRKGLVCVLVRVTRRSRLGRDRLRVAKRTSLGSRRPCGLRRGFRDRRDVRTSCASAGVGMAGAPQLGSPTQAGIGGSHLGKHSWPWIGDPQRSGVNVGSRASPLRRRKLTCGLDRCGDWRLTWNWEGRGHHSQPILPRGADSVEPVARVRQVEKSRCACSWIRHGCLPAPCYLEPLSDLYRECKERESRKEKDEGVVVIVMDTRSDFVHLLPDRLNRLQSESVRGFAGSI